MAKPSSKTEAIGDEMTVHVQGDIRIQYALEFKKILSASFERTANERLVLAHVTAFDVTGVQLAYVWRKELMARGRLASIRWPENQALNELLEKSGITKIA